MGEDWRTWKVVLAGTRWHTCAVMKSCPWDRDQVEPVEGTGFRAYMSGSSGPCAVAGVRARRDKLCMWRCNRRVREGAGGGAGGYPGPHGDAATARATAQTSLQSDPLLIVLRRSDVAADDGYRRVRDVCRDG